MRFPRGVPPDEKEGGGKPPGTGIICVAVRTRKFGARIFRRVGLDVNLPSAEREGERGGREGERERERETVYVRKCRTHMHEFQS